MVAGIAVVRLHPLALTAAAVAAYEAVVLAAAEEESSSMDVARFVGSVASSIVWAIIGVAILIGATWLFDHFHPINFQEEIKRGNVAAALLLSSIVLGISLIVFAAVR